MYIHETAKLIYLASPRTASYATSDVLVERYGFDGPNRGDHHRPLQEPPGDGWFIFTTVRNHFDAFVSMWFHWSQPTPFGREFIEHSWLNHQTLFPCHKQLYGLHAPVCNRLLRYERLNEDLNALLRQRGLEPCKIPWKNDGIRRQKVPYQTICDHESRLYIEDRFREELRQLNYKYEPVRQ